YMEEGEFEAVEKDFQEVIDLLNVESLEKFRTKYEKLHAVMQKSHENEKHLMEKCKKLGVELAVYSSRVSKLTKLCEVDQETISSLKTELEKAWKMVDMVYEKEKKAKGIINSLQKEIEHLKEEVRSGRSVKQDLKDMLKFKELTKERDQLLSEVEKLRQSLTQATEQQQDIEKVRYEADQSIIQLKEEIELHQKEALEEAQEKEIMEKEMKNLLVEMDDKQNEIKNLQQLVQRNKEEQVKMERHLKEQKMLNEKNGKELEQFQTENTKLMKENQQHTGMLEKMLQHIQQKTAELKAKNDEVAVMNLEISKLKQARNILQNKLCVAEEQNVEAGNERTTLKNQIGGLERELETAKKQVESDKKTIDELVREKDKLNKNMVKATSDMERQLNLVKLHEQSQKNLETKIKKFENETEKQNKIICHLENEKHVFISETSNLKQKIHQHLKDIETQQMQICGYEKKIEESATKLKEQENSNESLKTERDLFRKNMMEAKEDIAKMKERLKTLTHQMNLLREDYKGKEEALAKAHVEHQQTQREKRSLQAELLKMKEQAVETKQFIECQEAREKKFLKIIAEADAERLKQKQEFDQVMKERNIIGSQLVRRNDEVALLYEKINIQQDILKRGEALYRQRMEDIRLLKLEIININREKGLLSKNVAGDKELRQEIHHLQKELLREQTRCKFLEEESYKNVNVHRWRKIQDPNILELIEKTQRLQKLVIKKTDEVIEKELLLQEKDKKHVELELALARQAGPQAAKQLQLYRKVLEERSKQMKALSAELKMCVSQNQRYKQEIERLTKEIVSVKKDCLFQRHKQQKAK
ncbi:CFA58 protein, partial [Heliornis fulica]|nr:CFA58 protein [Heliornis fulica]